MEAPKTFALGVGNYSIPLGPGHFVFHIIILVLFTYYIIHVRLDKSVQLPEFNPRKHFEVTDARRVGYFMRHSIELLTKARNQFGSRPFKLFCDWGDLIVLPPSMVDFIKSDRRFDFAISASDDSHGYIPGFDGLGNDPQLPKVVTRYLTKALAKVTAPLSDEAALVMQQVLGDTTEWHELDVQNDIMSIVSRMSSRVFMGEELGRDDEWNKVSSRYALKVFSATDSLREYPRWARPIVHWFMPNCREVRQALADARKTIRPHIERRAKLKAEALAKGDKSPFDDSIEWLEQAGFKNDAATGQISLSLVAIHTTTDLLQQAMIRIAQNPELFQPLREEVVDVLKADGLKKTALYNLKLMDSVLKESQRLKPILIGWKRMALEDVTLPNGLVVKKGQKTLVDQTHMWNPDYYEDAERFDGYRFLRMRDTPGEDHMAHLVSTSTNHLGFGHGVHACPGRFFASNEVKIALCHLLLKYDWKMADGPMPKAFAHGMSYGSDPSSKLLIRKRAAELDFSSLAC